MAKSTAQPTWETPHAKSGTGKNAQYIPLDLEQKKRVSKTLNGLKKALDSNQDMHIEMSIKTIDGIELVSGTLRAKTAVSKSGQAMLILQDREPLYKRTETESSKFTAYGRMYIGSGLFVSLPSEDTTHPTPKTQQQDRSF